MIKDKLYYHDRAWKKYSWFGKCIFFTCHTRKTITFHNQNNVQSILASPFCILIEIDHSWPFDVFNNIIIPTTLNDVINETSITVDTSFKKKYTNKYKSVPTPCLPVFVSTAFVYILKYGSMESLFSGLIVCIILTLVGPCPANLYPVIFYSG